MVAIEADNDTDETLAEAAMRQVAKAATGHKAAARTEALKREAEEKKPTKEVVAATLTAAQQLALEVDSVIDEAVERVLARPASDLWTLDRLKGVLPTIGDLNDDGEFLFTFLPMLGDTYCQERYSLADVYLKSEDNADFTALQLAYVDIIFYVLRSWPLRETVQDADGNDIYDKTTLPDGTVVETVRSIPLRITKDVLKRLGYDLLTRFLNAMARAMRGEVKGQPS